MQMLYVKQKSGRRQVATCNLCGNTTHLTWDHVPPKGGVSLTAVEIRSIAQTLKSSTEKQKYVLSQNGVKFRTLCKNCNDLLGHQYDPTMNQVALNVSEYLKSELVLPEVIKIEVPVSRLARAILGHLLAGKVNIRPSRFDELASEYVLDSSYQIPEGINIYYWLYPFTNTVVMRDFGMANFRNSKTMHFCQLLKYFPVAYLVSNQPGLGSLRTLNPLLSTDIDAVIDIPFSLTTYPHSQWPEAPQDYWVLLGGEAMMQSTIATPRRPLLKSLQRK